MKVALFSMYYIKLRLSVSLGIHYTANPLGLWWRWHHWEYRYYKRRNRS